MGLVVLVIVWVGLTAFSLLPGFLSGYLTERYLRKRRLAAEVVNVVANVVVAASTVGGALVSTYALHNIGTGLVSLTILALSAALVGKVGGTSIGTRVAKTLAERKKKVEPPTT
jgi:MFS family permease